MKTEAGQHGRSWCARRAGAFTLIETLASVLIIGVLLGVLIAGVRFAATQARDQAEGGTVRALGLAVRQFESEFGFLPPLVHDGEVMSVPLPVGAGGVVYAESPVDRSGGGGPVVVAYQGRGGDLFLRGYDSGSTRFAFDSASGVHPEADERYSKFSLAYYVVGALGADVDGIDGPGFNEPRRNGVFNRRGGSDYGSFFDAGRTSATSLEGDYLDFVEYRESDRGLSAPARNNDGAIRAATSRDHVAIVDRNGRAYRYYRWEPGDPNAGRGEAEIATVLDLNIPSVLLNPVLLAQAYAQEPSGEVTVDPTEGRTELRSARWAIVGAGSDGAFGTEDIDDLREILGGDDNTSELELRRAAREDNLVEVGG